MARDRQRAKQRQAERRARRLAEEQGPGRPAGRGRSTAGNGDAARAEPRRDLPIDDPTTVEPSPAVARAGGGRAAAGRGPLRRHLRAPSPTSAPAPGRAGARRAGGPQEIEDWEVDDPDAAETGAGEDGLRGSGPAGARRRRGAQAPPACRTVPDRGLGRAPASPVAEPAGTRHAHRRRARLRPDRGWLSRPAGRDLLRTDPGIFSRGKQCFAGTQSTPIQDTRTRSSRTSSTAASRSGRRTASARSWCPPSRCRS